MKAPTVKRVLDWDWDVAPKIARGRCSAPLKFAATGFRNAAKRDKKLDPALCNNFSKYTVNGRHYCRKHAGLRCLDLLDPVRRR